MSHCEYHGLWKLLYDWQTIIAGIFALVAGYIAYAGARCAAMDGVREWKEAARTYL